MKFSRRAFATGTAAAAFGPWASLVRADLEAGERRFVSLYFSGGWDVLLGPDARDPASNPDGIDLGTELLAAAYRDPIPVQVSGTEVLWGSPMAALVPHADVLTLFQGVNMNTVAHASGRAYVNTFIAPAGVVPKGDSLATRMASATDATAYTLPNVAIGVPSFNHSFPPELTAIGMRRADEAVALVSPVGDPLDAATEALLRDVEDGLGSCVGGDYEPRPEDVQRVARLRVRELLDMGLEADFDLLADADLAARYGIVDANSTAPAFVAGTVWRLLELGLSNTVTAQLQGGLDDHGPEWQTDQAPALEAGFAAMAALLDDLRADDPDLAQTTVVAFSEFGRTPKINGRGGRDHWFASSILVFGGGLRRGVFGSTVHDTLGLAAADLQTGLPSDDGVVIQPEHVGATLAAAAGLDPGPFRVEPLDAWIGG